MMRKGVSGYLITVICFFLFIMMFLLTAAYASMLLDQAEDRVAEGFRRASSAEKLLSAPCATHSRGVFYADAVESGDFRCIFPLSSIFVRFESQGLARNVTSWRIRRNRPVEIESQDFDIDVRLIRRMPTVDDFYSVTIYNKTSGKTYGARMGVHARWPSELVS